jgi:DNA repair exonuclease SbcCD ATPase subunit
MGGLVRTKHVCTYTRTYNTYKHIQVQLQLHLDAAKARQVQIDTLSSRCTAAEQERERVRVTASVLEAQNLSQANSLAQLSRRLEQVSMGAASSEQGSAVAGANAFHAGQRAQRAEDAERMLSGRVETLTKALRDSEGKCQVLLQELARTEKVRVAAENEGRARAAAEAQAGEMLKELTKTRAKLEKAQSQVFELQGCARALEGAGEDAALARQLVVEKEAECAELRRRLEASHKKLEACRKKADAVRSKEEPLLQRVQQAEAAQQEAKARVRELETNLASAKREAAYARGEQREREKETADMRRQVVVLERAALVARERFFVFLAPRKPYSPPVKRQMG